VEPPLLPNPLIPEPDGCALPPPNPEVPPPEPPLPPESLKSALEPTSIVEPGPNPPPGEKFLLIDDAIPLLPEVPTPFDGDAGPPAPPAPTTTAKVPIGKYICTT